jgi:tRNA threonylcarbamoyladenosine biosynthesis protein TsaE
MSKAAEQDPMPKDKEAKASSSQVLEYETKSAAGTIAIGRRLADLLTPPRLMILRGDLGAGKTTLVKGIATALGAADSDEVTSPTFTLVHEYSGSLDGKVIKLLHLDLYRLDAERQLDSLGIEEMRTPDAIILVEWGEKFKSIRKHADGEIAITTAGGDTRKIVVTLN